MTFDGTYVREVMMLERQNPWESYHAGGQEEALDTYSEDAC